MVPQCSWLRASTITMAKPQIHRWQSPHISAPGGKARVPISKVQRPRTHVRAVNMYVLPDEDNVSPEDKHDTSQLVSETEFSLLSDLQLRFEDMWHDYAAARKRNMSLQIEKEELQTQLRNTTVALKQEQHNCRRAEERAALLESRLQSAGGPT